MPIRAAGDSPFYELSIIDGAGSPRGRSMQLPSASSICKALPKGGLEYWGMKLGVEGTLNWVLERHAAGELPTEITAEIVEAAYEKLKADKTYHPYHVMKKAGSRGTDIHDIAETLLRTGKMPPKSSVTSDQLPYAKALWTWWKNMTDKFKVEVIAIEQPVFSLSCPPSHKYQGYAGTFDAILLFPEVDLWEVVDFKTSKDIYDSHLIQVTAYKHAAIERGWTPQDAAVGASVVQLGATGEPKVRTSHCEIDQFYSIKQVWEWLEDMKGATA